jgi:threonine aldolase
MQKYTNFEVYLTAMRSFASDNNSGVHPRVMEAVVAANRDHAVGYGDDPWTEQATAKMREIFGPSADPFLVFNGTGANSVALQAVTRPFNSILCAATGHIYVDECGAPGRMTGCTLTAIPTPDGKLTPEALRPHLTHFGVCHHPQPGAVYLSQATELGTIYTANEIRAIAELIHPHGMALHMDGARLANACAAAGCTMREMTADAGVDILSFGGTKNGMMMGEAVVSFRPEFSQYLHYYRKQSAQLASKMRYLSAQFPPYLDGLWLENAAHANRQAKKLEALLRQHPQVRFTQPVQTNQLFFTVPKPISDEWLKDYFFYIWNETTNEVRLVTSWDTTDEDIERFKQKTSGL